MIENVQFFPAFRRHEVLQRYRQQIANIQARFEYAKDESVGHSGRLAHFRWGGIDQMHESIDASRSRMGPAQRGGQSLSSTDLNWNRRK